MDMKIKVGEEIKIGGKKRMIIEIQRDMFNVGDSVICFDDKFKVAMKDVKEDEPDGVFDNMYTHDMPEAYDGRVALWIYKKLYNGWLKTEDNLNHVYIDGMIVKKDLIDGAEYIGYCRNAERATWNAYMETFEYQRDKFGSTFVEAIVHPEDDCGYDVFVPTVLWKGFLPIDTTLKLVYNCLSK
jgi:hypothetical protein